MSTIKMFYLALILLLLLPLMAAAHPIDSPLYSATDFSLEDLVTVASVVAPDTQYQLSTPPRVDHASEPLESNGDVSADETDYFSQGQQEQAALDMVEIQEAMASRQANDLQHAGAQFQEQDNMSTEEGNPRATAETSTNAQSIEAWNLQTYHAGDREYYLEDDTDQRQEYWRESHSVPSHRGSGDLYEGCCIVCRTFIQGLIEDNGRRTCDCTVRLNENVYNDAVAGRQVLAWSRSGGGR